MKARWIIYPFAAAMSVAVLALTATTARASLSGPLSARADRPPLHRCANDYEEQEIADMQANSEDGYEPDDCPLLAHTLTGPMGLNFCQPVDEDWAKFKARANMLYQIRAEPSWNYPTEPHLELFDDGNLIAQNDHYFGNNAEVWWWNAGVERMIYIRITELQGRSDCGNSAYTLSLHAFAENPYPPTATPTGTAFSTLTPTPTPSVTPTPGG